MKESLIFKYSPCNLNELEINSETRLLLKTFIDMDNLNMLFIGDSGSGKSSIIKVIINEYYKNIPLETINSNILIINSLKEQGISYYRSEVKTFCQTQSSIANKKKFLILDDIDIINEQSQQVFRNCIDKYNKNIHFIASCNNPQKVIDSLQSRLNIIKIPNFSDNQLTNILNNIIKNENIDICENVIPFIVSISQHSVRILINYLEKFILLNQKITLDIAQEICTNILYKDLELYTINCSKNNLKEALNIIFRIYEKGYSVMDILDSYFLFIKITDLLSDTIKYNIIKIICSYITIFNIIHEDEIELAFFTNNIILLLNNNNNESIIY